MWGCCLSVSVYRDAVCLPVSVYRDAACLSVCLGEKGRCLSVCMSVSVYRDAVCLCIGTLSVCLILGRFSYSLEKCMSFSFQFSCSLLLFFYFVFVCNSCHVKVILKLYFEIFSLPTPHSFVCTTACFLCLNAAQIMFIMFGSVRNNL